MLAEMIHILGFEMADDPIMMQGEDKRHPRGYWERNATNRMVATLIQSINGHEGRERRGWFWPPPLDEIRKYKDRPWVIEWVQENLDEVRKPYPWGFKCPGAWIVIDLIHPHLINPYYVALSRTVKVHSLHKTFAHMMLDFPYRPLLELNYEDILEDPKGTVIRLAKFLEVEPKEEAYLIPTYKHQHWTEDRPDVNQR